MNALVEVDAHLFQTPDGRVWAKTMYGQNFWNRYLDVFDTITVISRMQTVEYSEVKGFLRSDCDKVNFESLPMARGPKEYVKQLPKFVFTAKKVAKEEACAIIRLPSISGTIIELAFRATHKPYVLEVVVDPATAFKGIVGKFLTLHLKTACKKANGVSYVTQYALQRDYPSRARISGKDTNTFFETYYSSIDLNEDYFSYPREYSNLGKKIKLIHTANNIKNSIKGHDIAIKVVKQLNDAGIFAEIVFVGDGEKRVELETMAKKLNISDKVIFTGVLSSPLAVREELLNADLFLFPTKSEGLPRAIIEAMAVGLPCLSTPVNGIPELLEAEYLFDPLDVDGFTGKIIELISDYKKMNDMSRRNIKKAHEYEADILQKRRKSCYEKLKNLVTK